MKVYFLTLLTVCHVVFALQFERIFPEITGDVYEINCGSVENLSEYGYFFVSPDSGLVYYNYSLLLECQQSDFLSIISTACLGNSLVTNKIYCALGSGSYSDGIYEYNTDTKEFSLKTWLFSPKFVKYIKSGFYAGGLEGLIYSDDGNEWSEISDFTGFEIYDTEETSGGILFVGAKVPSVTNAVLFIKNGDSLDSLNTGFDEINDIYYRKSGDFEEVLVTLGNGSYSDGLYRVLYNDSTMIGLELVEYIYEPNLVFHYPNYYIVTSKNTDQMTAVPVYGTEGESLIIEHNLEINSVFCYSNQYPVYTANFLIGTDQGVYLATGYVGIEDQENTPIASMLHQNYPNPFNPETTIRYSLSEEADVKLTVFDITGREVAELVSGSRTKGNYSVNFNAVNLTSGLYFYKLSVDGKAVQSKKMMMLK